MTTILGHRSAQHAVAGRNVLLMNSPGNETEAIDKIQATAKDCLYLIFHDIYEPRPGLTHPTRDHVQQALDWGRDKDVDDLVCVCQAGVSRSSGMALVLNTAKYGVDKAFAVLDINRHSPNALIVRLGGQILGCEDELMNKYFEYVKNVDQLYTDLMPLEIID